MDPQKVTAAWTLAKTSSEIIKKLFEFEKSVEDLGSKRQIDEMLDTLRDLKQSASELEDENRELREKLRFKTDEYDFKNPFWYDKAHSDRALCAKCYANNKIGPMGEKGQGCDDDYRCCLVCDNHVEVSHEERDRRATMSHTERNPFGER